MLIKKGRRVSVRIDNAHLAAQHVDELRERLDARAPEEPTEPPGRCWPIGIVHSSSKFQHFETATAPTDACPAIQNRSRAPQFNGQHDDNDKWQGDREQ